ncbi:MAG: DUF1549 domain-containing protein [Fuerstiella sp.]|nr:DUF1549 domain-containing protein [Fuerstiella sp.]
MLRPGVMLLLMLHGGVTSVASEDPVVSRDPAVTAEQFAFFETNIRPVLVEHCFDCHSGDDAESRFDVSSRAGILQGGEFGPAIRPGQPAESLLISAIRHDEFLKMPPKQKLSTQDVVNFTRWVEMGAPWPNTKVATTTPESDSSSTGGMQFTEKQLSHWAFQPVADPQPPAVGSDWPVSPVDHFIFKRLLDAGLLPAAPADKRTLIRRATYDLTGLPPTPAETEAFLVDHSEDAFAKVIDRLLGSPRYGEHWGRHWLDIARYADTNGLDENLSYANAFRYRDYVISAFNSDKRYPRFVQEQIAGDLLPQLQDDQENMNRLIANGFLAIGPKMLAEDDPMKMQMDIIDEQVSTLGQTFMGLTLGCARCHDHKFDPLPTEDYYSLAGIFKSSKTMENHEVVAVWYERQLESQRVREERAEIDRKRAEVQTKIDRFTVVQRAEIAQQIRRQFGDYLLAAGNLQLAHQQKIPRRPALMKQDQPFEVRQDVTVLEGEAFHRGDLKSQTSGYGEGIGVILSDKAGFAEFDLKVSQPGLYQLELRFAAAENRPLKLSVNGSPVDDAVAGQVTGSWYPDGQRWFPGGQLELKQGKNTIRFYSDGPYPHIDRLLLVRCGPDGRPASAGSPCLSQIAADYGVNLHLVELWRDFLDQVRNGNQTQFPSFGTWLKLSQLASSGFAEQAAELLVEQGDDRAEPVRQALIASKPMSLRDVAAVYQNLLTGSRETLPEAWFADPSPLAGPTQLSLSVLVGEARQQLKELYDQRTHHAAAQPDVDVAMGVTEDTPEDLRIHLRGSHIVLGDVAPRRFLRIIGGLGAPEIDPQQSGRLQLARWMTQPDHPLVGRVIVNRVWHWRFGRGLTPSVDNFGLLGQPPTHPKLLDWLTRRFVDGGGSLKQLHRMMMLSSTYRMSTQFDPVSGAADPDNNMLWRFRRRRLTGEELRDSMITLGTGLDLKTGGSLLKVQNRKYVTGTRGDGITSEFDNHRRSVYVPVVRSAVYDVLQAFDFPDPAVPAGKRQTSTVAPQALMLMNSVLSEEQTLAMARRLIDITDDRQKVFVAVGQVFNRPPGDEEISLALAFINEVCLSLGDAEKEANLKAWQSYCRVLLSSNEFAYVE